MSYFCLCCMVPVGGKHMIGGRKRCWNDIVSKYIHQSVQPVGDQEGGSPGVCLLVHHHQENL